MQLSGMGDLAQSLMMRRQNAALQNEFSRLTSELTSGKKSDIGTAVSGNFTTLASVERQLAIGETYSALRNSIKPNLETLQNSFEGIKASIEGLGADLVSASLLGQQNTIDARLADAPEAFSSAVKYLNAEIGGRFLLSGVQSDTAPLISSEEILEELRPIAAAALDEADFTTQIDAWFLDAAGGFETIAYQGGAAATSPISIDDTQTISQTITADDPAIRELLRDLSITALASEGSLTFDQAVQNDLTRAAAEGITASEFDLVAFQAEIGVAQGKLEEADVRGEAERTSNSELYNSLVSADPFDVATQLESVQIQLESLYLLTARTSQLSLMEYLR